MASHGFPARYIATAIGITQCVGMLGGSAGQFIVGPLIQKGLYVSLFWIGIGIICGLLCIIIFFVTPREKKVAEENSKGTLSLLQPYKLVFGNLQSYLSGVVSGLLFAPTTIFAMTWGIAFFQHDRHVSYSSAVLICSMVPLGWVVGAPL